MIDYIQISLGFSIAAMLICFANIICCIIQKRTDKPNNRLFLTIMGILFFNALNSYIVSYTYQTGSQILLSKGFKYLYFITYVCLFPVFFVYILNVCGITFLHKKNKFIISVIPFLITELICITNPITHWVYTYDTTFIRNPGEFVIYLSGFIYYIGAFGIALKYWKTLSIKRKYVMIFSFALIGAGSMLQLLFPGFEIEALAEAIGFTGILMVIENEDDRMEPLYGIYNRHALEMDLITLFAHKETAGIIFIKLKDTDTIVRKMGASKIIGLYSVLSDYLKENTPWYHIYLATQQTFVLIIDKEKYEDITINIQKRLFKPFNVNGSEIMADAVILYDLLGENIKKMSEVFYIADTPLCIREEEKSKKDTDAEYYLRRLQVEKAVSRGLEKNSFEVYYQPTFTAKGKLHGAEALLRMHDDELGDIYPDEFIPAAENLGIIDQIDDFVLKEVCKFLKSGIPNEGGISYINVNLSVLECIKDDFINRIEGNLSKYGIDKSWVNFEITESAAVTDYDLLSKIIHHLKREGFRFSMDDFGTGYSNLQAAFSLGLDIIKIDKSILWAAEQNDIGRAILESNIGMIKKIGKEILVEGVETSSQVDLLRFLKADYLQGFYFSKPIKKEEFINMIQKEKHK